MGGRCGFSLIEVMTVMAVAGLALGGIGRLVEGTARAGAVAEVRMRARWAALGALEGDPPGSRRGPVAVEVVRVGDRREARVSWPGGALRLGVWVGHD